MGAVLQPFVEGLDAKLLAAAIEEMEQTLGGYPNDVWTSSPEQRLRTSAGS